jgi:hypothetical protein
MNDLTRSVSKNRTVHLILFSLLALALMLATSASTDEVDAFPDVIPLPNGFQPEGIVIGEGTDFYAGSLANGSIFHGSLRTGEGEVLVPPQEGRIAVGLDYDRRTGYIFTAGGPGGAGYVYDSQNGESVAAFSFTSSAETFVNDVFVTEDAAYFTDSMQPFLYKVPLARDGGLPDPSEVEQLPLGGDYTFTPGAFNANGITAPFHGRWLVIVNSSAASLYIVDPGSGDARLVDTGGVDVPNGDGLVLDGRILYVVQNRINQVSVFEIDPHAAAGKLRRVLTDPDFRVPTTADEYKGYIYAVNARFGEPPTPDTEYEVVRVRKWLD